MMNTLESAGAPTLVAAKIARLQRIQDFLFHRVTQFFSLSVLFALLGIIGSLFINAWPALKEFGPQFFITPAWDIVNGDFGGTGTANLATNILASSLAFSVALG